MSAHPKRTRSLLMKQAYVLALARLGAEIIKLLVMTVWKAS
jgi:hypothetical protein